MDHPFAEIEEGKLESLNLLQAQYIADGSPQKVDLMCGVYRTDEREPFVFPSVRKARQKMFSNPLWNHEYPPSHLGTEVFRKESQKLFFGADHPLITSKRLVAAQVLGGSGANHIGAVFLKQHYRPWRTCLPEVYIPGDSWANHPNVFSFLNIKPVPLPYYSRNTRALDFPALHTAISAIPPNSVVVLQTCAQSPTGCDPIEGQWQSLASLFAARGHFAFFDAAYPGLASGDFGHDVVCVRVFADEGVPLLVAATYGKVFGLYGERVGILLISTPDEQVGVRVDRQLKLLARAETGAMPAFGAAIVETILTDEYLRRIWEQDVKGLADKLRERRSGLRGSLESLGTPGDWKFLTEQKGMFSFMGFTPEQIETLRKIHHVYLQDNGRLSIASLCLSDIDYVAHSIDATIRNAPLSNGFTNGHAGPNGSVATHA